MFTQRLDSPRPGVLFLMLAAWVVLSFMFADLALPQQRCKTCPQSVVSQPATPTHTATMKKMEGWAQVPGGTVYLEPGRQAYEHDTGLVRDLVTGQKSRPITPQSLQYAQPVYPQPVYPRPLPTPLALGPQYAPWPYQPIAPVYPMPYPLTTPYRNPHYDVGPYGYYNSGRGAMVTGHGATAPKWRTVGSLPK